jgi:uncharacterized protein with ParB-like and HNH nuclease domain
MSNLSEKPIQDLLNKKFFIPDFQRGYRWKPQQVEDLLKDVWEFSQKTHKTDNEWYCLQPVVVKKRKDKFEIIDGQQRLTTIFLILKYLGKRENFEIEYQTRNSEGHNSKNFLRKVDIKNEEDAKENIDYFHIHDAYQKIKERFDTDKNQIIKKDFSKTFLENTKVIWYEVDAKKDSVDDKKDSIEIFTRLNMGKIPLTNAELIKALFLNSSNFPKANAEELRLKQLEIASEWDRMEYALQNDEFWYFLNTAENKLSTRIDFLFNVMKNMEPDNGGKTDKNDDRTTYRFFSKKFKNKNKNKIEENWKEIKRTFQILEEWFTDRELYHKVGYLIATNTKVTELLKESKNKCKQEFRKCLDEKIAEKIKCDNLEELEYGGKNNSKITNVLLLHNIQTLLNNENNKSRFPFDRYKSKKRGWSLEHIHAQNSKEISESEDFKNWYENLDETIEEQLPECLREKALELLEKSGRSEDIPGLVTEISNHFGEVDIHTINNLTLLSKNNNSALNNGLFPTKRKKIIELEKEGAFIPICTKNVFQKFYDGCTNQFIK